MKPTIKRRDFMKEVKRSVAPLDNKKQKGYNIANKH